MRNPAVSIYHNFLWSRYKGVVFSELYTLSCNRGVTVTFAQVAETSQHVALKTVDLSYHTYPYRLLFTGAIESVPVHRRVFALAKDLIQHKSDIVVLPSYDLVEHWVMLGICILLRRKRAVICDAIEPTNPTVPKWKELAKKIFFGRCDGFFCYGIRSKEYLMRYGVEERKIKLRRQAAALPRDYSADHVRQHFEGARTESPRAPRFVYVGRFSKEKGLFDLIEAFRRLKERLPEATLNLVGGGVLREPLSEKINALGLQSAVTFAGALGLEQIAAILLESTALVLPSHSEPWGLVVNEALSYGCPVVVSSACGCLPELVTDGVTGYSFEVGNIEALSQRLFDIAALCADRAAVAANCLDAISQYTPQRAAAQMLEGCIELLASS